MLWAALAGTSAAAPDGRDLVWEDSKNLVVMIEGAVGSSRQEGAGIIVGSDRDGLFIATADHVVREGDQAVDGLTVRFRWRPDQSVPATLLPNRVPRSDASARKVFDLAVVRVARSAVPAFDLELLPIERTIDPGSLKRGDDLYFLGFPQGRAWYGNVTPAKFAEPEGDLLTFETDALLPGYSGGALLDSNLNVAGLMIDTEGAFGTAIGIDAVLASLKSWGIPSQLGEALAFPRFESIGAGHDNSCGITAKGFIFCWSGGAGPIGENQYDSAQARRMDRLPGGLKFTSISVGPSHACGITAPGDAYCFGYNDKGQLGGATDEGFSWFPQPVIGGLKFRAVSAGESHSCGVTVAGRAYCWGEGWQDKPVEVASNELFSSISSGKYFSCALAKGSTWCWSRRNDANMVQMEPGMLLEQLSSGPSQSCATARDGRAVCWGHSLYGLTAKVRQDTVAVIPNHQFLSVTAGDESSCGLTRDHRAWCWGNAIHGALGSGWTAVIENHVIADEIHEEPVAVQGGHRFKALSAGWGFFACGVTDRQELLCWGRRQQRLMRNLGEYGTTPQAVPH
jgi:alpha-tubulin suppressor-like RCC1 family protein